MRSTFAASLYVGMKSQFGVGVDRPAADSRYLIGASRLRRASTRHSWRVLVRVALGALAVAIIAWSVVLVRDNHEGLAAGRRLFSGSDLTGEGFERQLARLHRANTLNPDERWEILRAAYLIQDGQLSRAERAARAITRREPENAGAWATLLRAAEGRDARTASEAELSTLAPQSGGAPVTTTVGTA